LPNCLIRYVFPTCLAPLTRRHSFLSAFFHASSVSYILRFSIRRTSVSHYGFYHSISLLSSTMHIFGYSKSKIMHIFGYTNHQKMHIFRKIRSGSSREGMNRRCCVLMFQTRRSIPHLSSPAPKRVSFTTLSFIETTSNAVSVYSPVTLSGQFGLHC